MITELLETSTNTFRFEPNPGLTLHKKLVSLRYVMPLQLVEPSNADNVESKVPKFDPETVMLPPTTTELAGGARDSMTGA